MRIEDIWLYSADNWIYVYVKIHGKWHQAIREYNSGPISHCITSYGLALLTPLHSDHWLNQDEKGIESWRG